MPPGLAQPALSPKQSGHAAPVEEGGPAAPAAEAEGLSYSLCPFRQRRRNGTHASDTKYSVHSGKGFVPRGRSKR